MLGDTAHDHLARAITAAAEAVSFDDLVSAAIPSLLGAVGARRALLYRYREGGAIECLGGNLVEAMRHYTADLLARDPLQAHPRALPAGLKVVMVSRVVDRRAFVNSDAYGAFYGPLDLSHVTCVWLTGTKLYGEPGMTGLLLSRGAEENPFTHQEGDALGEALPALAAAVRRSVRLEDADTRTRALEAVAAGAVTRPIVALSAAGRVLWMSRAAETLLGPACTVPATLMEAARNLAASANGARLDRPPSVVSSHTLANGATIVADSTVTRAPSGEALVLAELTRGAEGCEAFAARARAAGLTRAEGEVLYVLSRGVSNAEIAARLHVSVETVRTHVARILHKLSVGTRAQAAIQARAWMG